MNIGTDFIPANPAAAAEAVSALIGRGANAARSTAEAFSSVPNALRAGGNILRAGGNAVAYIPRVASVGFQPMAQRRGTVLRSSIIPIDFYADAVALLLAAGRVPLSIDGR